LGSSGCQECPYPMWSGVGSGGCTLEWCTAFSPSPLVLHSATGKRGDILPPSGRTFGTFDEALAMHCSTGQQVDEKYSSNGWYYAQCGVSQNWVHPAQGSQPPADVCRGKHRDKHSRCTGVCVLFTDSSFRGSDPISSLCRGPIFQRGSQVELSMRELWRRHFHRIQRFGNMRSLQVRETGGQRTMTTRVRYGSDVTQVNVAWLVCSPLFSSFGLRLLQPC
jgi:hypothetical protein